MLSLQKNRQAAVRGNKQLYSSADAAEQTEKEYKTEKDGERMLQNSNKLC